MLLSERRGAGRRPSSREPALPPKWPTSPSTDPPARVGRIEIITGPMFAGKSTELLRRVAEHRVSLWVVWGGGKRNNAPATLARSHNHLPQAAGRTVAVISSSRDTRYADGGAIATHAGRTVAAVAVDALAEVDAASPSTAHADVVAIDEAQFFDDLVPYATAAADGRGQTVVVAGLDGDAARRPFGGVLTLIPHAERVDRLAASCAWCGRDAHFSVRLGGGKGAVVVGGGADTYAPACRSHYAASGHLPPPPTGGRDQRAAPDAGGGGGQEAGGEDMKRRVFWFGFV